MNGFSSGTEPDGCGRILCICALGFTIFCIWATGINALTLGFSLGCFWILQGEGML